MTNRLDELRGLLDADTSDLLPWWSLGPDVIAADGDHIAKCDGHVLGSDAPSTAALIVFLRNHAEDLLAVARAAYEEHRFEGVAEGDTDGEEFMPGCKVCDALERLIGASPASESCEYCGKYPEPMPGYQSSTCPFCQRVFDQHPERTARTLDAERRLVSRLSPTSEEGSNA